MRHITRGLDRELKKGSAELLILSLVESRPRHGYFGARRSRPAWRRSRFHLPASARSSMNWRSISTTGMVTS
jgi:hypothetical protein